MLEEKVDSVNAGIPTKKWDDTDQCQMCHEAIQQLHFKGDEIEVLSFKIEKCIIQKGIKKFGEKGNALTMNETSNLSIKNDYFGEVDYDKLSQEMKDKAFPVFMLIIIKRNEEIKSRGYYMEVTKEFAQKTTL